MKATWRGATIANSDETVIVEGNHYFPQQAVSQDHLEPSSHSSFCPWKGTARYYHVVVNGTRNENAAWYYPEPKDAASQIAGRIAFWHGVEVG